MSKLAKALSASAGNAGGDPLYVEDVFSTFLYNGNSSNRNIVNGVDLTEGGLVWTKARSNAIQHELFDTERGIDRRLVTNSSAAEYYELNSLSGFNSNGFSLSTAGNTNGSAVTYASWTFRKAEKFFDVVTYSGSNSTQAISHNLGSVPAMILVKRTDTGSSDWVVYNQNLNGGTNPEEYWLYLNENYAPNNGWIWNKVAPTSTTFTVGGGTGNVNVAGGTYVAYIFASDAGGFGDDEDENIIKCGGYTADSSNAYPVTLGFEPQFVLIKRTDSSGNWEMLDTMRGFTADAAGQEFFYSNSGNAEASDSGAYLTATGFVASNQSASNGASYIYMAIRMPMKTPEAGTEVFALENGNGGGSSTVPEFSAPFASDLFYMQNRNGGGLNYNGSRLAGNSYLQFNATATEASGLLRWDSMNGMYFYSTTDYTGYMFKRATGFMDVVAYSGSGSATTQAHNLGVAPELLIIKPRSLSYQWSVWNKDIASSSPYYEIVLNNNKAQYDGDNTNAPFSGVPSSTVFPLPSGTASASNRSGYTYIAYLFATLAGISKVGSYTGTAADLNVDCGFTAGARWIMIKRTDSTGDWYVWDSARGITAGNDPYLLLNTTAAQVTNTDYIDPLSSGFTVTSSAPAALNASGGTYIFLAIA